MERKSRARKRHNNVRFFTFTFFIPSIFLLFVFVLILYIRPRFTSAGKLSSQRQSLGSNSLRDIYEIVSYETYSERIN